MRPLFEIALGNAIVAGVLGVGVLAISRVCRRPALIHCLWIVVLVKLVTPPMVSLPVRLPSFEAPSDVRVQLSLRGESATAPEADKALPRDAQTRIEGLHDALPDRAPVVASSVDDVVVSTRNDQAQVVAPPAGSVHAIDSADHGRKAYDLSLVACLMAVWVIGIAVCLLRSVWRMSRFGQLLKYAEPADPQMQRRLAELATRMGINRVPQTLLLPGTVSPMLWAFGRRTRLLMPGELLDELSPDAQQTVLAHELAHYRRGDHWVRGLELIVSSLFWWHPIVWLAMREIRQMEEACCDAWVVQQLPGHRGAYARTLVQTIAFLSPPPTLMPAVAGVLGIGLYRSIEQRIRSIMSDSTMKGVTMSPSMRFVLVLFALLTLPLVPTTRGANEPAARAAGDSTNESASETNSALADAPVRIAPAVNEPTSFAGGVVPLGNVADVAISPDGRLLAAGHGLAGGPGALSIWNLENTRLLDSCGERRQVSSIVFSPDGRLVAYGTWDNLALVRRLDTLSIVHEFTGFGFYPVKMAFSTDGRLAVGQTDIQIYDTATWQALPITLEREPRFSAESFDLNDLNFSPDGSRLAATGRIREGDTASGGTIIWDAHTGQRICVTPHAKRLFSAVFSPDGLSFATAAEDGRVQICDAATGEVRCLGILRGTPVYNVAWSPDGKRLVASGAIRGFAILDADTARVVHLFGQPADPQVRLNDACFTRDGSKIITGSNERRISIWDTKSYELLAQLPSSDVTQTAEQPVHAVACSPDGRWIAAGGEDASVALRDMQSGDGIRVLTGHEDVVAAVAFAPDGTLASAGYDQTIKLWDAATGTELRTLKGHDNWVFGIAFSPDGAMLASCGYDKTVRVWHVATGEQAAQFEGHAAAVRGVAFSPDGTRLASASSDRTIKIWDVATGAEVAALKGHEGAVRAVAFSPDGGTLVTAAEDGSAKLWSTAGWTERQALTGHQGMIWSVAFSAGGKNLATGGFDQTIRIWNPGTGELRQVLQGHQDAVSSVAFAPDTSALVSGGLDRTLRIWRADVAQGRAAKTE